jgi:trigger factor
MESTIRETSSIRREIDITLTQAEIAPYYDKVSRKAQQNVQMKGFRKGKVPLSMIKKMYGASIEQDAIEQAVQEEFGKYAELEHIHSIGTPIVTRINKNEAGGVDFTILYEILPEIELGEYKGLTATKIYHIVSEDEINQEIDRIRENYLTLEEAESIENENFVATVDIQRVEDGELVPDAVSEGVQIYLRRTAVNSELKASLLNTRVGDTFRTELPTGEDESMMTYEITIRKVERALLPEVDDEFARKITGDEDATPQDVIDVVKQAIESEFERRYQQAFRDELIGNLLEAHPFEVPEAFIQQAFESFEEDMKKGSKKELPAGFDRAKFQEEMRPVAERTVRWALLRDKLVQKEELQADDADFEGLAQIEAQRTGLDVDTLLKYFKRTPATTDRILAEKAIQLLEDYAIVNEVEDLELQQQQPQPAEPQE